MWLLCWWVIIPYKCCCRKNKEKERDPGDDGQNDFGVSYHEFVAFKNGDDIGKRELPRKYAMLSVGEMKDSLKMKVRKVVATKENVTKKKNKLENKLKMQIKLGKGMMNRNRNANDGGDNDNEDANGDDENAGDTQEMAVAGQSTQSQSVIEVEEEEDGDGQQEQGTTK